MDTPDKEVMKTKIIDSLISNNPEIEKGFDLDPVEFENDEKRKKFGQGQ